MVSYETVDRMHYGLDYSNEVFLSVPYKRLISSGVDILMELEDLVAGGAVVDTGDGVFLELHTGENLFKERRGMI